jgi:hypothetical protein
MTSYGVTRKQVRGDHGHEHIQTTVCETCGCEVVEVTVHDAWHARINAINRVASRAEQRSLPNAPVAVDYRGAAAGD